MGHLIPSHLHLISTRIWIPILYPSAERLTSRHLTMPLGIPLSIYLSTNPLNRPTNYSKQEEEPFLSHVNRINPGNQRTNQWLTNQNVCFVVHYVQAACLAINLKQLLCFLFPLLSSPPPLMSEILHGNITRMTRFFALLQIPYPHGTTGRASSAIKTDCDQERISFYTLAPRSLQLIIAVVVVFCHPRFVVCLRLAINNVPSPLIWAAKVFATVCLIKIAFHTQRGEQRSSPRSDIPLRSSPYINKDQLLISTHLILLVDDLLSTSLSQYLLGCGICRVGRLRTVPNPSPSSAK